MSFIITVDKRQDWWSLASRLIADEPLAAVATSATHFDKLLTLFHSVKIPEMSNTLSFGQHSDFFICFLLVLLISVF